MTAILRNSTGKCFMYLRRFSYLVNVRPIRRKTGFLSHYIYFRNVVINFGTLHECVHLGNIAPHSMIKYALSYSIYQIVIIYVVFKIIAEIA